MVVFAGNFLCHDGGWWNCNVKREETLSLLLASPQILWSCMNAGVGTAAKLEAPMT